MDDGKSAAFVARHLGKWFPLYARDLSWRQTRDPYAIWVSEVMLQQTRVETVKSYYGPFLKRFPSVQKLAKASEEDVVNAWSGLGYYRRARLLHRGAKYLVEHLGGQLPKEAGELRKVPGIGPYSAGAVASIAFDSPVALVDGNVARVCSRFFALQDPKQQDAKHAIHWRFVQQVLERGSPRTLAQALMELGATLCTPRKPKCDECPLKAKCLAKKQGLQERIPAPKQKKKSPEERYWAIACHWGQGMYLRRREDRGLLAGMWMFPLLERKAKQKEPKQDEIEELFGVPVRMREPSLELKHVFSHRIWQIRAFSCQAEKRPKTGGRGSGWIRVLPGQRPPGGTPSVAEKLLEGLGF